jgi:CRP/FNR family transcriptional regulator, cyclic AMP receptor protein
VSSSNQVIVETLRRVPLFNELSAINRLIVADRGEQLHAVSWKCTDANSQMRRRVAAFNVSTGACSMSIRHFKTSRRRKSEEKLAGQSETELAFIATNMTVSRYEPSQVVFCEGEKGGDLLIVEKGTVKVVKMAASGRHQLIAIERTGSSLDEVSIFDRSPYSTTAIAVTSTVLLRLHGDHFRSLCLTYPQLALKVIRVLGHRLRHLRRLVEELSFATVRDRLIAHFLRLGEERGIRTAEGIEIELEENNEELASRLGTVRELVSRNLGRLHGEGLIVMHKRAVTIPDAAALRAAMEA